MNRPTTRPQVMPAVTGTIALTVQLVNADTLTEFLEPPQQLALTSTLSASDADLPWRFQYAYGQQLDDGSNWKGRRPAEGTDEQDFLAMLVVDDQIGPAMQREVEAGFAKAPEWDAVQGKEKLDEAHEIITALTAWHDESGLTDAARDAARFRWWAGSMTGRVYVPDEYQSRLAPDAAQRPRTLAEALDLIHVHAVDPREGGPIKDRHGRVLGYWYRYSRLHPDRAGEEQSVVEVHTQRHVLTLIAGLDGKLELESDSDSPFHDPGQPQQVRRAEYLMWHAERDGGSSITRSVRDAQDRLDVVNTYMGRNDDQTGYRQIIVSNAEPVKDKRGNVIPFPQGPGVAVNLKGLPMDAIKHDPNAKPQRHTPTWQVIEPLNPEQFHIPSINRWKASILEKLDQLWTLTPDVQVSGESKRQSRKPFDRRVAFAAQDTGGFIAWALRAALMLAGQMLGQEGDFREVTFQPKMFLDVDAANLEELRIKLQMWESGALTLTSLLESTPGVSDAAKEAKALEDGEGSPDAQKGKEALERLTNPGPREDGGGGEA